MKIEITLERLEEMALCIVDNNLNQDEACEYAKNMALDCHTESLNSANNNGMQEID